MIRAAAFLMASASAPLLATGPSVAPSPEPSIAARVVTRHVTHTYLRALPGKRAALIAYIERNWFAMDRIGIAHGLFTGYTLLKRDDAGSGDWDVIVAVGYPTPEGHDAPGVAAAFSAIRAAHQERKIDGQGLKELGVIVRHDPLVVIDQSADA